MVLVINAFAIVFIVIVTIVFRTVVSIIISMPILSLISGVVFISLMLALCFVNFTFLCKLYIINRCIEKKSWQYSHLFTFKLYIPPFYFLFSFPFFFSFLFSSFLTFSFFLFFFESVCVVVGVRLFMFP